MDKIGAVASPLGELQRAGASAPLFDAGRVGGSGGFADALAKALESTDGAQRQASDLARKFQLGDAAVPLEETMIAMQKANVSFQALVQVRNRMVSAYHDIMTMQV